MKPIKMKQVKQLDLKEFGLKEKTYLDWQCPEALGMMLHI